MSRMGLAARLATTLPVSSSLWMTVGGEHVISVLSSLEWSRAGRAPSKFHKCSGKKVEDSKRYSLVGRHEEGKPR